MSNSATGGYLVPTTPNPFPGGITFEDFIQTVIVGITGIDGTLVRPKWQKEEPIQPSVDTNWVAFGIQDDAPDAYAYTAIDEHGVYFINRQKSFVVQCSFYGPNAGANASAFTDGFQITQNLEAMQLAGMGFTEASQSIHAPELVNELWYDRYELTVTLVRQVIRSYPILSFTSATGTINVVLDGTEKNIVWDSN